MNFSKDKPDTFILKSKNILLIHDLRVLGIYTFLKMMLAQEEDPKSIINKMKDQFYIDDKMILDALEIITVELGLLTITKK